MDSELDLTRLAELHELLDTTVPEIVATLVHELDNAVDAISTGLKARDLPTVALAAHAGRNSALMIGARPLLARLGELESSARNDDLGGAKTAFQRLRVEWPALRARLERAAAGEH